MARDFTGKGYWGKCVEVDLNTKTVTITDRHMQYIENYCGGRALGMKLLWETLKDKPGYDAMGPENPVMFIPGPVTGTSVPFSSRYQVVSKSALTRPLQSPYETPSGVGYAACGGHFGPNVKWSGFDMVYITGESDTPVMLKLDDNTAELIDATECWGLDIPEAQEWAKNKYGVEFATSLIGPAAEQGVRWADVAGDTGRAAARGGSAVILGKRKFKGIIARGSQAVPVDDDAKIIELRRGYYNELYAWTGLENFRRWGTILNTSSNSYEGKAGTKNHLYGETPYVLEAGVSYYHYDYIVRHRSCVGCVTRCMKFGVVRTGKYKGTIYEGSDYEAGIMNVHNWLIKTGEEGVYLAEYVESQGMDCINTGCVVGCILEFVEKGYLKAEQIGIEGLTWGETDKIHKLLENIIYNHDNPFYDAARGGAMAICDWLVANNGLEYDTVHACTAQTKNNGFAAWYGPVQQYQAVNYALSSRGACHMNFSYSAYGNTCVIRDCGVYCTFASQGTVSGHAWDEMLNAVLGVNLTSEQWAFHGARTLALEKCMLIIDGFRRRDDWPSERMFDPMPMTFDDGTPTVHGGAKIEKEWLTEQVDNAYDIHGWDKTTSCPTRGRLQELGHEDMIPYVEEALALTGETLN